MLKKLTSWAKSKDPIPTTGVETATSPSQPIPADVAVSVPLPETASSPPTSRHWRGRGREREKIQENNAGENKQERVDQVSSLNSPARTGQSQKEVNMLKLKVEVLLSLLAVKDSELSSAKNKIEALSWAVANPQVTEILIPALPSTEVDLDEARVELMSGMNKVSHGFRTVKAELLDAFSSSKGGPIPAALPREQFTEILGRICSSLSTRESSMLALRFSEFGNFNLVSVAEFMEFFSVSPQNRHAKSAKNLLRRSDQSSASISLSFAEHRVSQSDHKGQFKAFLGSLRLPIDQLTSSFWIRCESEQIRYVLFSQWEVAS